MSTINNRFSLSHAALTKRKCTAASAVLLVAVLAPVLGAIPAKAAPGEQPADEKPRRIVAVFRLAGPLTEIPVEEAFPVFGPPGSSLKELVTRLGKAAEDSSVKAVVLLPESASMGSAQVEELRAAL